MLYYIMSCYAMLCYVMLCNVILCYIMSYYVMLYCIILCYTIYCNFMLCYSHFTQLCLRFLHFRILTYYGLMLAGAVARSASATAGKNVTKKFVLIFTRNIHI